MTKSIAEMTSAELFALAQQKEQEESSKEIEANKQKVADLRAARRELIKEHNKELNAKAISNANSVTLNTGLPSNT